VLRKKLSTWDSREAIAVSRGLSALAMLALTACESKTGLPVAVVHPSPSTSATATAASASADAAPGVAAGEWHQPARDYAQTRYSALDQLNTGNADRLRMAWTFSDGTTNGHEAAPLVVGHMMYLVTPFPNIAFAIDLAQPGTPIVWSYKPDPKPLAIGKACCDTVNRGAAYADGKLIYNLLDDETVAVDAKSGTELWRTTLGDPATGETMTMAPLVAAGKVFVGNSGGELGARGWLAALDLQTGKLLWRAYSTGSDADVKIGADFKPFYPWLRGKDLGLASWPAGAWKQGGGASWGFVSYDPELDLIYYGTSNPSPRVPAQRPGDNLWTSSVFARDPATGMARWAYQFTPHDEWDYDGVNENVLLDLTIDGKRRKTMVQFNRNGFAYTLDRLTGEVLIARPFAYLNWAKGMDLKTGRPIVDPDKEPHPGVKLTGVCPPDIGGKDWQPSAFSPRTGLVYAGIFNLCMDLTDHEVSYIAGTPYDGMEMKRSPAPGGNSGEFMAWDPATGTKVWAIKERFMTMSGALATAGDLVFYGTVDGWFRTVDARNGKVLWSQKLGSGIIGQPVTYLGPDGRQYVAIYAGIGGAAMVASKTPGFPAKGSTLYVFSLDGVSPNSGPGQIGGPGEAAASGVASP
jgi:alcohol dehydrogenase (cytochrome c)